jgi:hypothetical protein
MKKQSNPKPANIKRPAKAPTGPPKPKKPAPVPPDPDIGFIATAAVRYALGRSSYAPDLVMRWVERADLTRADRTMIAAEVFVELDRYEDEPPYAREWRKFAERQLAESSKFLP